MHILNRSCLTLIISLVLPVTAFAQKTTTVAVVGTMTGTRSGLAQSQQMKIGAEMAVNDINASGGLLGRKLVLNVEDDACDAGKVYDAVSKVIRANASFVAGHYCSFNTKTASEMYAQNNVLLISPAATASFLTDDSNVWSFARVVGRDDQQGTVAGTYIARNYRDKNIAILHNGTESIGTAFAEGTKKALNGAGVTEKFFQSYAANEQDFTAIISRLKSEKIDLVYVGGYPTEAGLLLRQMREQGLRTLMMGAGDLSSDRFRSIAGAAADGVLFSLGADPRNKVAANEIIEKSKNIDLDRYALNTYAAFQVWSKAAAKAGTLDARKVMKAIKSNSWDTVIGQLDFDAKGDIKRPDWVVYKWNANGSYGEVDQPPAATTITTQLSPTPKPFSVPPAPVVALPVKTPTPVPPPVLTQHTPAALPKPPADGIAHSPVNSTQLPAAIAQKGRRIALVIGNSKYKNVPVLPNPQRDAKMVAEALKQTGFAEVTLQTDLGREALAAALQKFSRSAQSADWAVVYFAGHGMEIGGVNYLIPIDAKLETDRDIQFEAVPLSQVLNVVESASKLRLVVLDACRVNPFANSMKRQLATRAVERGFARTEPDPGTLVVYAAKDGEVASDGNGSNSPFSTAFVQNLQKPGVEINKLFRIVRDDVLKTTNRTQTPYTYGSLSGADDFYFVDPK